ncbi:MAG TPA: patatin-like phospholipase family protein [Burkholderiaceae bacterium]|nr:patatin-like phospholipase family protein [Burkholderiaceae bacterium]
MFSQSTRCRTINLALQGGGAHGAFTWGVLDALLEEERLRLEAISGTSAGAMNAVVLAHGLLADGRQGARVALQKFWSAVAASMPFGATVSTGDGQSVALTPAFRRMLRWANEIAPDRINPFDRNPLRDILGAQIDFERLRARSPLKLFVAATNANSGKLRLFRQDELSVEAVLASACLPMMHRAVEIDGEPYWDGGYAANPAVFPLFYECRSRDILLVLLSPLKYKQTPYTAQDIKDRILEFGFTATFLREMRMFAHLRDFVKRSWFPFGRFERRIAATRFHVIDAQDFMSDLTPESKIAANLQFFTTLKELGRQRTKAWLQQHFESVGRDSSVAISELFY